MAVEAPTESSVSPRILIVDDDAGQRSLLNAFLKPIIVLLTLPVTIITLGLFTFVINALIFYLAANLVPGLHVTGFGSAFIAALLFSLFSFVLNMLFGTKK